MKKFNWNDDESPSPAPEEISTPNPAMPKPVWEGLLLTTAEAATLLKLSSKGLRKMALAGKVSYYKIGRYHRYRKEDVLALITKA